MRGRRSEILAGATIGAPHRRLGVQGLGGFAGVASDPITLGLEIEPGERRPDGLRDMQGQRPVDRDEAVRDERPRAPIAGLDVRLCEIGRGEQPGQRRQVRAPSRRCRSRPDRG
jgi:hypothetical protein